MIELKSFSQINGLLECRSSERELILLYEETLSCYNIRMLNNSTYITCFHFISELWSRARSYYPKFSAILLSNTSYESLALLILCQYNQYLDKFTNTAFFQMIFASAGKIKAVNQKGS